ncbi:MAG: hypothetical protein HZB12_02545 [Candidatus Yonathbacteria bacterium]|nr:hypothetical protein [Candidatus Yonathbacteria bacterium]
MRYLNENSDGAKKRILFDLVVLATVFYAPWWLSFALIAAGAFNFSFYAEAVVFGALIDLLYGTALSFGLGIIGFIFAIVIFVMMRYAKSTVRPGAHR